MLCRDCNSEVSDRSKFCPECGSEQMRTCATCGERSQPQAKFCSQCGGALVVPGPGKLPARTSGTQPTPAVALPLPPKEPYAAPPPEAERRQLSVMFCDLADSTRLSARLDPEDLRDLTRAYQEAATTVIHRYGGHVAQLLGDGILVYFGYPHAHEDDPIRAGRAGLEIIAAINELPAPQRGRSERLAVRIGIHTGPTVVGRMGDGQGEQLAIGETPNLAARLQALAEPNTVLISSRTAHLVRRYFERQDLGLHQLKGLDRPERVYRLIAATAGQTREHAGQESPFTGRESELALLHARFEEAERGKGRMIALSGDAGIGKSRLLRSFADQLAARPHVRIEARCSPYHKDTALHPLAEMTAELCGLGAHDSPAERAEKVATRLSAFRLSGSEISVLATLLGVELDPARFPPSERSPQMRKLALLNALVALFLALAQQAPLLLLVEDLHWLDPSSLDLLERLSERMPAHRILCVTTFRTGTELPWPVDAHLALARLPRDQAEALISELSGGRQLPADVVERLAERAGGNPLYLEELTRMVMESGDVVEGDSGEGQRHLVLASDRAIEIPAALQDSLTARLDRLSGVKLVAQVGATIGRRFDYGLLKRLLRMEDTELTAALATLTDAGILYQRGALPDASFVFRHALLQDAAYGSLLRSTRRRYHQSLADILASSENPSPELLAHHYQEAGDAPAAIEQCRKAGEAALGNWALAEAIQHLQRGIALVPQVEEPRARVDAEIALRVVLGVPLMLTRGFGAAEVAACFQRLRELCESVAENRDGHLLPALYGLWQFHHVKAEYPTAELFAIELADLADRTGDGRIRMAAHMALGATRFWRGRVADARQELEAGLALYERGLHGPLAFLFGHDAKVFCESMLTWVHWHDGDVALARQRRVAALATCAELKQPGSEGFMELLVGTLHNLLGEFELAERHSRNLVELSRQEGMPHWEASGRAALGWALGARGQLEPGREAIRHSIEGLLRVSTRTAVSFWQAALAEIEIKRGDLDGAAAVLSEARAAIELSDEVFYLPELMRLEGEVHRLRGPDHFPAAAACFNAAAKLARDRGCRPLLARAEHSLRQLG